MARPAPGELPPAAAPAASPPLGAEPDGRVVPLGAVRVPAREPRDPRRATLDGGRSVAVVDGRARVVDVLDAATGARTAGAPAGVGPAHVASDGGNYLFVTDTAGGALLVYHLRPELALIRRYPLPGSPYAIAVDTRRGRIFVTQTARNQLTELRLGGRPSFIHRYATPRRPDAVAIDPDTGRVFVTGRADGVLQLLDPARERTR